MVMCKILICTVGCQILTLQVSKFDNLGMRLSLLQRATLMPKPNQDGFMPELNHTVTLSHVTETSTSP